MFKIGQKIERMVNTEKDSEKLSGTYSVKNINDDGVVIVNEDNGQIFLYRLDGTQFANTTISVIE